MTLNERFIGAWTLVAGIDDGTPVLQPPVGMVIFDRSGHFCADIAGEPYTAYFGTWSADDGESGTLFNRHGPPLGPTS